MKKKGEYGYQKNRRIFSTIWFGLLLAADLVMFFVSKSYFGTIKNLFSIFVVLVCLPIGMLGVNMIMHYRAGCCSPEAYHAVRKHEGSLDGLYDLYLTSYSRNFQLSHLAVCSGNIIALTEAGNCDTRAGEEHIRTILQNNGYKGYHVKIFNNLSKYCERLDSLNELKQSGPAENLEGVKQLIRTISI